MGVFLGLKDLKLDHGTNPEKGQKGMKFLVWLESVLKLGAPQWLLKSPKWPAKAITAPPPHTNKPPMTATD